MSRKKLITSLIILIFTTAPILSAVAEELVVYSARKKTLTRKPFSKFSRDTGIRIKVLEGSASELMEKIKNPDSKPVQKAIKPFLVIRESCGTN